jgi:CheY-like chemotaxis protein
MDRAMSRQNCVLVVDDDPITLDLMSRYLPQAGAGSVLLADNANTALALLEHEQVDLVIIDIMMPDMNGYDLTKMIRRKLKLVDLPIIAITSQGILECPEHASQIGIDQVLAKPVDLRKLRELLNHYLGEPV